MSVLVRVFNNLSLYEKEELIVFRRVENRLITKNDLQSKFLWIELVVTVIVVSIV